jgi:hypothetical protein
MIRKLLLVAATVALPVSLLAATGATAGAKGAPKIDATDYTVACTGFAGSAKFTPPLKKGFQGSESTKITATLSGCTATGPSGSTPITSITGKLTGTTTNPNADDCEGLENNTPITGTLTTKWTTTPKLTNASSVVTAGTVTETLASNGSLQLNFSGKGSSGPFQGTNAGASDATSATTVESAATLLTACSGKSGVKTVTVTGPPSGSAVSLG